MKIDEQTALQLKSHKIIADLKVRDEMGELLLKQFEKVIAYVKDDEQERELYLQTMLNLYKHSLDDIMAITMKTAIEIFKKSGDPSSVKHFFDIFKQTTNNSVGGMNIVIEKEFKDLD